MTAKSWPGRLQPDSKGVRVTVGEEDEEDKGRGTNGGS